MSIRLLFVGIVFSLVSPQIAQAQKTQELLMQAAKAYAELEIEQAIQLLDKAISEKGNTFDQLIRIYHLRGLCNGALNRTEKARIDFAKLLALDPTFRLGDNVSPRIRDPMQQILNEKPRRIEVGLQAPPHIVYAEKLTMVLQVKSNPQNIVKSIKLYFRRGSADYSRIQSQIIKEGDFKLEVPAPIWMANQGQGPLYWYAVVEGPHESSIVKFGDEKFPMTLDVIKRNMRQEQLEPLQQMQQPQQQKPVASQAWYKRWWLWTIVGGVAITAVAVPLAINASTNSPSVYNFDVSFD